MVIDSRCHWASLAEAAMGKRIKGRTGRPLDAWAAQGASPPKLPTSRPTEGCDRLLLAGPRAMATGRGGRVGGDGVADAIRGAPRSPYPRGDRVTSGNGTSPGGGSRLPARATTNSD